MKNILKVVILFCYIIFINGCGENPSFNKNLSILNDLESKDVIVVAHRAKCGNAPENSLEGIKNCIEIGVDAIEIDIRETKDGHLILMHDNTIERTTTGKGLVSEYTLKSLKNIFLKNDKNTTTFKIPTLEEVLLLSKDKILVNLDKSYVIFDKCFKVIKKTNTENQIIMKAKKEAFEIEDSFAKYLNDIFFMPIIFINEPNGIEILNDYLSLENKPRAYEIVFNKGEDKAVSSFEEIKKSQSSIWINSMWGSLCNGHDDKKALEDVSVYNWYITHHINIIQTDEPKLLISF